MVTMPTEPSSSTAMSAPVSCWMVLMTLPFGPMTSPILSIGMVIEMIFGAVAATSARGSAMQAFMLARICRAGFLGLIERGDQHVGGDALDLGVELQRRDRVGRAGDLEVHVAERVLGTEDVGEGGVLALGEDEAHGDAGDGRLDRHTGVHQRQAAGADRRHRRRTVRGQHLGDEAQRVAELLLAGQHRHQRTGGERTVADLAALRRTDTTGLTVGPRGHVVVEQEVLVGLRAERVHQLVHARHGHGDDVHHLGLATLEQAGAVRRRQHGDLAAERTQVAGTATVDAQALVDDALADRLLGQAAHGLFDLRARDRRTRRPRRTASRWPRRRRRRWRRCARPWR